MEIRVRAPCSLMSINLAFAWSPTSRLRCQPEMKNFHPMPNSSIKRIHVAARRRSSRSEGGSFGASLRQQPDRICLRADRFVHCDFYVAYKWESRTRARRSAHYTQTILACVPESHSVQIWQSRSVLGVSFRRLEQSRFLIPCLLRTLLSASLCPVMNKFAWNPLKKDHAARLKSWTLRLSSARRGPIILEAYRRKLFVTESQSSRIVNVVRDSVRDFGLYKC